MAYIDDNLVKYRCLICDREFIISDYQEKTWNEHLYTKIKCPFCVSPNTKAVAWMDDEDMLDMMGCMGMVHEE